MTFNNIICFFFSFSEENSEVDVWDGWFSGGEYLNLLPSFIYTVFVHQYANVCMAFK